MNILEPTRGSAHVLGVDSRNSPCELAQIGYVSENQDMPEKLTVAQFLAYLQPFYPTWDGELERSLVSQLRLPQLGFPVATEGVPIADAARSANKAERTQMRAQRERGLEWTDDRT
jgi:hypothetical protein